MLSASSYSAFPGFNVDTIDGVGYRIDLTQPARYERDGELAAPTARRIVDLQFDGKAIDEGAEFVVVTNNYRASGGGAFPGLDGKNIAPSAPDENREALVRHLNAQGRVNPSADGNWRIQAVPGIKLVEDNGDGSALYALAQ